MLEAPHYSAAGARRDAPFALPTEFFDGTVHEPVLHQAVRAYLNNQRQGTASTKTRSFVSGGNQKPWKQKGTGRARQGSTRAPHWRGGGIVFGPHPRKYTTELPRKVRQLARRSALNARAREGALHVVERLAFSAPKTAELAGLIGKLGVDGAKVLVLTAGVNRNAYLSGRNLQTVEVLPYAEASAYEILWSDVVVVEEGALTGIMPEIAADETEAEAPTRKKAAKKSAAKSATRTGAKKAAKSPAAKPEKTSAKKPATKATAKKSAPKQKGGE